MARYASRAERAGSRRPTKIRNMVVEADAAPMEPRAPAARAEAAESPADRKRRARKIVAKLHQAYPDANCALHHRHALQLLISTILSAQSTDETVNKVTPDLFKRYPTAKALAEADPQEVEKLIYRTGFFRQKTKSIIGACRRIVEDFGGDVPGSMEELLQLPGVARKTANVVLGTWFGKNIGVVVDTHVGRLAHRLALTWTSKHEKDALRIEKDLMEVLAQEEWTFTSHALIWHGRRICTARKPLCEGCVLSRLCPSAFTFENQKPKSEKPKEMLKRQKTANNG